MQIQWLGQSCFKIQTKTKEQEVTVVTDPFADSIGLKMPKFQADMVTISHDHDDHNNIEAIRGEPFVVTNPGEYETKGVFVYGLPAWHDEENGKKRGAVTMYKINSEDINILHLSDLGHSLSDEQIEKIGEVDILLIPVGGEVTLSNQKITEMISEIEPRIVIPMHYQLPGLKMKLNDVNSFIRSSGLPSETIDKLKISKKDLIGEGTKIIILNQA